MVANIYEALLEELGRVLGVTLFPDKNNSCLVKFRNGIEVQFELDKTGDRFLMGTTLGSVPPSRYRDSLFREALKANGAPPPRSGVFAYSRKADALILYRFLRTKELNGEKISFLIGPFSERALLWKESISRGEVPAWQTPMAGGGSAGIFGLR